MILKLFLSVLRKSIYCNPCENRLIETVLMRGHMFLRENERIMTEVSSVSRLSVSGVLRTLESSHS